MDGVVSNHTRVVPNILSALTFVIPSILFYVIKGYFVGLFYEFAILFLLVNAVSNTRWKHEINKKDASGKTDSDSYRLYIGRVVGWAS